jgi:hypothetical protein
LIAGFKICIAVEENRFRIRFARRYENAPPTLDSLFGIGNNRRQHHLQMGVVGADGRQVFGQVGYKSDPGRSAVADQGQDLRHKIVQRNGFRLWVAAARKRQHVLRQPVEMMQGASYLGQMPRRLFFVGAKQFELCDVRSNNGEGISELV